MKYLTQWNNLDVTGKKGQGMDYRHDLLNAVSSKAFKYASLSSLMLSILFFFWTVV